MKKILVFLLLFLSLIGASAQPYSTILRGLMQTDMNGGGKKITNLVDITDSAGNSLVSGSKVKLSATDTTPDYLLKKILKGSNITFTTNNPTGNATLTISSSGSGGGGTPLADGTNTTVRTDGGGTNHVDVTTIPWSILTGVPTFQTGSANLTNLAGVSSNLFAYVSQLNTFSNLLGTASRSNGLSFYPITGNPSNFLITNGNGSLLTGITTSQISGLGTAAGSNGLSFYPITGNPSSFLTSVAGLYNTNVFDSNFTITGGTNVSISTVPTNGFQRALQVANAVSAGSNSLYTTVETDITASTNRIVTDARNWSKLSIQQMSAINGNNYIADMLGSTPNYDGQFGQSYTGGGGRYINWLWASAGTSIGSNSWGVPLGIPGGINQIGEPRYDIPLATNTTSVHWYLNGGPHGQTRTNVWNGSALTDAVWYFDNLNPWSEGMISMPMHTTNAALWNASEPFYTNSDGIKIGTLDQFGLTFGSIGPEDVAGETNQANSFNLILGETLTPFYISGNYAPFSWTLGQYPWMGVDPRGLTNGNFTAGVRFPIWKNNVWSFTNANWKDALVIDEIGGNIRVGSNAYAQNLLLTNYFVLGAGTGDSELGSMAGMETYDVNVWHALDVNNAVAFGYGPSRLSPIAIGEKSGPPEFAIGSTATLDFSISDATDILNGNIAGQTWIKRLSMRPLALVLTNGLNLVVHDGTARIGGVATFTNALNKLVSQFETNWNDFRGSNVSAQYLRGSNATTGRMAVFAGDSTLTNGAATTTEASYLAGVTSAIQTQLDAKAASTDVTASTNQGNIAFVNFANVFSQSNRFTGTIAVNGITATFLRVTNAITNDWMTASTVPYIGTTKVMVSSAVTPTELGRLVGLTVDANTLALTNAPTLYNPLFLGATTPVDNYVWTANGTTGLGQWEAAAAGGSGTTNNDNAWARTNWAASFTNYIAYGIYTNTGQFTGTGNTNLIINLTNNTYYATPLNLTNDVNFVQTTNRTAGQVVQFKYYIYPNGTNRNVSIGANVAASWHIRGLATTTVLYSTNIAVFSGEFNGLGTSETNVFGDYVIY